jgi:hypothetical protein
MTVESGVARMAPKRDTIGSIVLGGWSGPGSGAAGLAWRAAAQVGEEAQGVMVLAETGPVDLQV